MKALPLGRPRRLAEAAVFQALLRSGHRYLRGPVMVRVLPTEESGSVGLSIAKKLLKRATDRNLVKRIFREAYRARAAEFKQADILMMLMQKPDLKGAQSRAQLRFAADQALERVQSRFQQSTLATDR